MIDRIILFLLGICAALYSIFYRYFAKVNIRLPFFDFPIFIGEGLFFVCLILSLWKWVKMTKFHFTFSAWKLAFIFYLAFVLGKSAIGYFQYGPLALRHAAMFYYPLFSVIAYYAFQKGKWIFSTKVPLFLLMILIINFAYVSFYLYYYLILALILASCFKSKLARYGGIIITLAVVPYSYFFHSARTLLVASSFAFFALLLMNIIILRARKVVKGCLLFSGLFLIAIAIFTLSLRGALISLARPDKFIKYKKFYDKIIEDNKPTFIPKSINPQLYNPSEVVPVNDLVPLFTRLEKTATEAIISKPDVTQAGVPLDKETQVENKPVLSMVEPAGREGVSSGTEPIRPIVSSLTETFVKPPQPTSTSSETEEEFDNEIKGTKFGTMLFRLYIFSDAVEQLLNKKPSFGFAFGYPFRSPRCEMIGSAYGEYTRDGWISMHNSYLDIIYRAGLIGIILFVVLFINISKMLFIFLRFKSRKGIALITVIFFWLVICFFSETLELPYYAIPFWSFYGLTLAFAHHIRKEKAHI